MRDVFPVFELLTHLLLENTKFQQEVLDICVLKSISQMLQSIQSLPLSVKVLDSALRLKTAETNSTESKPFRSFSGLLLSKIVFSPTDMDSAISILFSHSESFRVIIEIFTDNPFPDFKGIYASHAYLIDSKTSPGSRTSLSRTHWHSALDSLIGFSATLLTMTFF